jgi:uncharacterized damage-inducible protein DinB
MSRTLSAFPDLRHELAATRRLLASLPDEHFGWKPHEKSFSLGDLGLHVVNLLDWQRMTLDQDEFDMATAPREERPAPANRQQLLERFDEKLAQLNASLETFDEGTLGETWTFRIGDNVILRQPRSVVFRSMGINHMVHHRAQLTVYLRLLDVPVPGLYGPSADEK